MNSLMPLVPEKTFSVCSNGLKVGEVVVTNQTTVKKENSYLIATKLDKPTNMACVYAGILMAIIGGILVAMFASGVGAVLGGLLLAALIGVLAAYGLGGLLCYFCLKNMQWDIYHPQIKIEKKEAIISSSKIICAFPIIPSGSVQLFFSKEAAEEVMSIYRTKNLIRIFDSALLGWGITKAIGGIIGTFVAETVMVASLKTAASLIGGKVLGDLLSIGEGIVGDNVAKFFIPVNKDSKEFSEQVDDTRFSDSYKEDPITLTEYTFNKVTGNDDTKQLESGGAIATSAMDATTDPIEITENTILLTRAGETRESLIKANNSVATYGPDGVTARGNEYARQGMSRSDAFKRAWSEYKQANEEYVNNKITEQEKARRNAKESLSVLGLSILGDTVGEIILSLQKNSLKNRLPEIINKELDAMQKIGIFEVQI